MPGFSSVLKQCTTTLLVWTREEQKKMLFAVPMIWRESSNCYFRMYNISTYNKERKKIIKYANVPFAKYLELHSDNEEVTVPTPMLNVLTTREDNVEESNSEEINNAIRIPSISKKPHFVN